VTIHPVEVLHSPCQVVPSLLLLTMLVMHHNPLASGSDSEEGLGGVLAVLGLSGRLTALLMFGPSAGCSEPLTCFAGLCPVEPLFPLLRSWFGTQGIPESGMESEQTRCN